MLQKIDKQWIGLVIGLIIPAITFLLIYFFAYPKHSLVSYYEMIMARRFFSQILSLAVIPNAGVFFLFIWANKLSAAKGVLAATFLLAIVVFAFKIFG
jgi:uncharacterized membrane protein SpoIIM required for sporulation